MNMSRSLVPLLDADASVGADRSIRCPEVSIVVALALATFIELEGDASGAGLRPTKTMAIPGPIETVASGAIGAAAPFTIAPVLFASIIGLSVKWGEEKQEGEKQPSPT